MSALTQAPWRERYAATADLIGTSAPRAAVSLTGASACVDAIHRIDAQRLERLEHAAQATAASEDDRRGGELSRTILDRVRAGRGGELVTHWPRGSAWFGDLLGPADRYQLGGTGPQASWTLAELGAPSVVALADRSVGQLAVLDPRIAICEDGRVVPVGAARRTGASPKQPHRILELTAGTPFTGGAVLRSTRLILRFGDEPVEVDAEYARVTPTLPGVRAGLLSGLNGPADGDLAGARWLADVARSWLRAGVRVVHHELAEFPSPDRLRAAVFGVPATSLGLSLSELRTLAGAGAAPAGAAAELAAAVGVERVIVHADGWSLAVHRGDPAHEVDVLMTGNLLAAARARAGRPTAEIQPAPEATYPNDVPPSERLGDGWTTTAVPAPYLLRPTATIGLGDTFVAGVLLAESST